MANRVAIIGGGLAGLTAAAFAARAGAHVRLYEARAVAGGRARTDDRDGFLLNHGPHALYEGGAGMAVLREIGVDPAGSSPDITKAFGLWRGRIDRLPTGIASALTTRLVSLSAKRELATVLWPRLTRHRTQETWPHSPIR